MDVKKDIKVLLMTILCSLCNQSCDLWRQLGLVSELESVLF